MITKVFKCGHCNKEHQRKFYENVSEATADMFTERFFIPIWDKLKNKAPTMSREVFCKELVFFTVYTYHRNRRRIKVAKDSIEPHHGTESQ